MADKLIFPIGFDLESGLKTAQTDIKRVARQLEDAINKCSIHIPVGLDAATAKQLREEAKDIDRVLANIKNNYGSGQLKGLTIGFVNTQKEIDGIKKLEAQLQALKSQRTSLVNAGATIEELNRVDAAIRGVELRLKILNQAFGKDQSSNVAISQQIVKLKQLAEELAGIDRMYARLQTSAAAANKPVNSFEVNEMLNRRREIMEEIARVTKTATEAQKELFNIKGVGVGASQGIFGVGGEQGLAAITAQIERYEQLKKQLQEVEGQYERLKAMQAQGMNVTDGQINQVLQRRIAIQKELAEITQTAAQAQKKLEKEAQATAAAFQRGRGAIENFNRVMMLPENRITNIQQKINLLNQALKRVGVGSTEFNKIVAELTRLGQKLDEAKAKQEAFTGAQKKSGDAGKKAFREQSSYLNILIKRLAVYTSLDAVMGFLTKVREVTAQFELQRISLGAIINDQTRANQLFNEIKQFALKSPIKILDLTKYTKQLAAFRFETDTLFDTTKRVADISVGLSVPMDRLVLALGHVKASTYLTGITLRQFSMAGIPMLELLAERFSELEGRAVSTTDVLKRIRDKMVSFEDVNQIFINLTSSGGMFYNMQEKQGNTLYGLWAKLGDAASVMYDQIGNTSTVNKAMKEAIDMLTVMMRNWRDVARVITEAGIAFGVYRLAVLASAKATALSTVWNAKDVALRQMHLKTVMAQSMHVRNFNRVLLASGVSAQKASKATWVFSRALNGLKGAIATTGIGALIIGLGLLIDKLLFSKSAAQQLKETLGNIENENVQEQNKSVRNFERLANIAVSASSTYKEQQAALEELKRTYKDIIPQERLTIENLKEMNGNYELLTASIRTYISERMKQKQIDEITNTYTYDILKIQRKIRDDLKNKYSDEQLTEFWDRFAQNVKDKTKSAGKSISDLVNLTVSEMGASIQFAHDIGARWSLSDYEFGFDTMYHVAYLIRQQASEIDAIGKLYDSSAMAMGKFADSYNEAVNSIKENGVKLNGEIIKREDNPLLYAQQEANLEIKDAMVPTIKEAFKEAGLAFDEGWVSLKDNVDKNMPSIISSINFEGMGEKAKEDAKELLAALQPQLDTLVAQREAYMKQIRAEESKGKGKNDEFIRSTKEQYDSIGEQITNLEERARKINAIFPLLDSLKKKYNDLAPSDSVVKLMRQRFDQIVDYTKSYAKNMRRFRMNADEDMEAYRKRLTDEVKLIKNNVKAWTAAMVLARLFRNKTEEQNLQNLINEAKLQLADLGKILGEMPVFDSKGGPKSDTRLQTLNEIEQTLTKINQKYEELRKKEGDTKALEDVKKIYGDTLEYVNNLGKKFGLAFEMPTDFKSLQDYRKQIQKVIETLKMKGYEKAALELQAKIDTGDVDQLQKQIEQKLKDLSDRIARTKTAREFYDKILSQTGSYDIAGSVTMSIYGDDGQNLLRDTIEQLQLAFENVDISAAIDLTTGAIDYNMLRKFEKDYSGKLIAERKDLRDKLISEGEKASAAQVAQWYKDIEKAKDYNQQYVDIVRETQTKIAEIRRSGLDKNVEDELVKGMEDKQRKALAKLQLDEFKGSDLYVRLFEDMDSASTTMLQSLKDKLDEMKKTMREDLTPAELKSLTQDIEKLEDVLQQRNPFQTITKGLKGLRAWHKENGSLADAEKKLTDAIAAEDKARKQWEADTAAAAKAQAELNVALQQYQAIVAVKGEDSKEAQDTKANAEAKQGEADAANDAAKKSEETYNSAQKTKKESQDTVRSWEDWVASMREGLKVFGKIEGILSDMTDAANNFMDVFAASDETRQFFDDVLGGLNNIVGGAEKAATGMLDAYSGFMTANPMQMIQGGMNAISGISSIAKGVTDIFYAGRIRRANKEIKRQQEILDHLQYAYSRLEKAADKLFGADYLRNYNQQLRTLQAQITATQKQLEAEQSKGKKADKDKIKEYTESIRDLKDELADMSGTLSEQMLGSDLASMARDTAKAWLDAYKEIGRAGAETTNAMKEQFRDMVENMVVEGALARVMERALKPMFDMIDTMNEQDFYNESFWRNIAAVAEKGAADADAGAQTMMKFLEQAGISIKDINAEYTGIKREVAGASSEEMNANTAALNAQNYYASHLPGIAANVALLTQHIINGNTSAVTTTAAGWTDWQQQAMDHYAAIQRNTADTVVECRRAAIAAENAVVELKRVIKPRTTPATHSLHVTID